MGRKIIEYEILCSQELGDLENIINDKLKDGYELYGYPSHLQEDDCRPRDTKNMATTHYQAMVLYDDSTGPKPTFQLGSDVFYD